MDMTKSFVFLCSIFVTLTQSTPLDDYVNKPDDHYKYEIIGRYHGPAYTNYIINMTSQKWKSDAVSDRSVWWHYLTITIPHKITHIDSAFLFIDGDSNTDSPPLHGDKFVTVTTLLGVSMEAITADLKMVPNQPITYKDDSSKRRRKEDAAVAWTWRKFLENTTDPEIIIELPMTKAAVRAMDTVAEVAKSVLGNFVNRFFVSGASKRGWTTWLTAAVDKRVFAMAPIVMNLLNMQKNLHHHFRSLGGWTFAFKDYYTEDITRKLDSAEFQKLANVIDPLVYKDRYKDIPKVVISTTGDEFFLLDDSDFYFSKLQENTYLRILPNAEHSCIGHIISLMSTLRSFFLTTVMNIPIPKLQWTRSSTKNGGRITLKTDTPPTSVTAFYARTLDGKRKDFRLFVAASQNSTKDKFNPVFWHKKEISKLENNTFTAEFVNPSYGWLAFFIQVSFKGIKDTVLELTTETQIIPETYPYQDCHGTDCFGILV